jgi:threonine-phosphate decarboxylase
MDIAGTEHRVRKTEHRQEKMDNRTKTKDNSPGSGFWPLCSEIKHGGNVYSAARDLGLAESEIIDFSASINPLGISDKVKSAIAESLKAVTHYPDPETVELRKAIASHHEINPDTVICGNGSTELIYLIPRVLKPAHVLIPSPTFSEYERACKLRVKSRELRVMSYELGEGNDFKIDADEFIKVMREEINTGLNINNSKLNSKLLTLNSAMPRGMAYLCNPNNPTGHLLKRDEVLKIADAACNLDCFLVVDEAFMDFVPEESVIRDVRNNPYLIVLRSMTKFYALTGLRIGYGVFHESIIEKVREYKEPWTVNTLAQKAAIAALQDDGYAEETYRLLDEEKLLLEDGFGSLGIEFYPSRVNYYLLRTERAREISKHLYKKGILVRDCSNFRGLDDSYIRVAVKSRRDNTILLEEMEKVCRG